MPHDHHHHAHGDRQIGWAIVINMLLTVAQIVGGLLSGSLALIADALHNFSDAVALILAFAARRIARRPADAEMTFGYGRAEVVAAVINYTTLVLIGLYLVYEAVVRFFQPEGVDGWMVVGIAALALVIDLATAALTWRLSKESVNIRAAFLHNVADALGSVAVIVVGAVILLWGWTYADPIATLMIAGYILWQSLREIVPAIRILMLGAPPGLDIRAVIDALGRVEGVAGVHHAHLWLMQEHEASLEAHLLLDEGAWHRAATVRDRARAVLADFGISHCTLELEPASAPCRHARIVGHDPAHAH